MKRVLKFVIPTVAALWITVTPVDAGQPTFAGEALLSSSEIEREMSPAQTSGCCWAYIYGMWYCIPCGPP